jgi:hypothetical protein
MKRTMRTKHDKPVTKIIPEGGRNMEDVRQAVRGIRALREKIAKSPGFKALTDKEIRDAINEGRR